MASKKIKYLPVSDSDSDDQELFADNKNMKLNEFKSTLKKSLSGIVITNQDDESASASMSAAEKKGLKEVEELERELDLKNTFSKETNRRDEDAEMNKFIDEQIRLRRVGHHSTESRNKDDLAFSLPGKIDDILLQSLSKNLAARDERSEAMLSHQMLNGIPEIDLGINERMRTIEATEEAKLRIASRKSYRTSSNAPFNFSSNFKHRSDRKSGGGPNIKTVKEPVVVVGEEPDEVEYRPRLNIPPRGRATDEYHLSRFKKNKS